MWALALSKFQSGPINNRRGKKNLVLSAWGDDSLLSEDCINPYYSPSSYQSYSEQTRQNLVNVFKVLILRPLWRWLHNLTNSLFLLLPFWGAENSEWRCYWLWSSWGPNLSCWWNLWRRFHTCILTCMSFPSSFLGSFMHALLFSLGKYYYMFILLNCITGGVWNLHFTR